MSHASWRRIAALACALAAQGAAAQAITEAETLLFQTNHLHSVRAPLTLAYAFSKQGSAEPGFDDQVRLTFGAGQPAPTMQFLSGARARRAPTADKPEGNPVLLAFLERDIAEMARLTGGAASYFRKRIRLALAQAAQVRPLRFSFAGTPFDGRAVSIEPFVADPLRQRFAQYAGKRYTFVVSAQVPGGIYQLRAAVPGAAGGAPLIDETLTLVGVTDDSH